MSRDLKGKKVVVTGGSSMIGRAIIECLKRRGADVLAPTHASLDLLYFGPVYDYFGYVGPDYIIHAAGWNGGIEWNRQYPSTIFERTSYMGLNVLRAAQKSDAKKVISIISSCAYPSKDGALKEEELWDGPPNPSTECHGFAKRMLHAYSRQLHKEHGLNATTVVINNSYGPYDSFHPEKTKVVAATIRKIVEAKEGNLPEVVCWGTGSPTREFVYSLDAAEGVVRALMYYEDYDLPLNISTGVDISIRKLYETVAEKVGYEGKIMWDTSKPDGQMKKSLDITRMKEILNWAPPTPFEEGISFTYLWYLQNRYYFNERV